MKDKKNRIIQGALPLRPFYRWHRRLGIIAVLFIVVLSITGIMLNHNAQFGLNKNFINSAWLLKIYNIEPEPYSEFNYPTDRLTVDQVVLDIHTARFFGKLGPFLMDVIAIILLILSGTGTYMWIKRAGGSKNKKDNL